MRPEVCRLHHSKSTDYATDGIWRGTGGLSKKLVPALFFDPLLPACAGMICGSIDRVVSVKPRKTECGADRCLRDQVPWGLCVPFGIPVKVICLKGSPCRNPDF